MKMIGGKLSNTDIEIEFGKILATIIKHSKKSEAELIELTGAGPDTLQAIRDGVFDAFYTSDFMKMILAFDFMKMILALGYDITIAYRHTVAEDGLGKIKLFHQCEHDYQQDHDTVNSSLICTKCGTYLEG